MSSLSHHGIKGQKWGIRRTPEQLGRINGGTAKVYKLHNYKGPLYFISEQELDGKTLHPRIPQNYLTQNGFEDNTTERVCFSHDPGKCLTAMSSNVSGKTFNVYSPADKHDVYKPNNITVPDADVTGELWIKEPVKLKKVGSIKCTGDTGEDGLKYTYGDQEAELYDWNYEWLDRSDQTSSTKLKHTSIGGTMYIEGNALILGDSSYLEHHGVRGQRWGVRRFQNKDGTRTAAGKKQLKAQRLSRNEKGIRDVYRSLSDEDFRTLGYSKEEADQERKDDFLELGRRHTDYDQYNRVRYKDGKAVGYIAATGYQTTVGRGKKVVNILAVDLAVHSEYRGNGYSVALGKDLVRWFDTYGSKEYDRIEWYAMSENIGSQKAAERSGFTRRSSKEAAKGWVKYRYDKKQKLQHTSIGGTMYIEGNTLILGDSSYLEHHGIRGQRWGVRRFQNRDGSLTNAGRKRLGYATKGAAQTVGKAFKAGVKAGGNAVKAVKAHHEKKEAEKLQKKKEKASKTRLGVMANKDLFTAKELKELNSKFEEQDKLTMARLKRGVEIVKAVGETAKSVGEVGKAYEAMTGHKLVPDIVTLQNGGSIDFGNKDKDSKDKDNKAAKDKDSKDTKDKDDGNPPEHNGSDDKPKGNDVKGSKWDSSDLRNQMEEAKKQASKAMKNAKLQEYIDAYNRDQNSEKNKELTARGQKAIEILSKGGGFTSDEPKPPTPPTPKAAPSSNNLMAQIRAAQTKLEKPNKNETPAEHKEAQKKLNALEKVANEYKAAANKPGTDPAEVAEKLLKKNKDILDDLKHMDFSDGTYLEHHGVHGMKWGKHLMAGKGGGLYDGTALGAGGGGAMTEEERKKAEELRKKKLEEAKKKAEEAAKEKEIEEKAKEIGISAKAYKNYSIEKNHLPGKHHYDKSQKLHGEASSSLAETQAAERRAHMNRAKAASLNRKVNSSHMFDADGYHISQQRGDDRKEAKRLQKEAKQLDKKSKKALKKFYKKRYKSDKERQKWQNSTSGKYHHMMRHYEIQNGTLFINAGEPYLEHHGVKGMKWGKHLMAGKGEAGAGGGGGEDDEKLKEMAKKAGMSVAEYRTKMAGKLSGAASKVGSAVYDAAGGSHKKNAEGWRKMANEESNAARASEKSAHKNSAKAASQDRKYGSGGDVYRRAAESDKENAKTHHSNAKARSARAASEQAAYEKSLAGRYDKMKAGGAEAGKRARKAVNELSAKATAAKKRLKDVPGELYGSKHRKDFERNVRLLEGSTRSAVEIGRDTYKRHGPTSGFNDPTYKATDDAYKRANKQWNKARISGQKYDRSIAKRVDSIARKVSKARKTAEQKKLFSGTSPKAKKAVIAKKKVTPTSYEKQISNARDSVEKAARSNENAYKHAKAVYRQTGSDSDAYKQAIKRSGTTLQRYIDSKKLLEKKKRAKHLDETGAIYTEGTRLVVNSKWG